MRVYQVNKQVIHLGAIERRAKARGIGNGEGVLRKGVQDPTRIVEEFESYFAGVDDGSGDLQVFQSVDIGIGGSRS